MSLGFLQNESVSRRQSVLVYQVVSGAYTAFAIHLGDLIAAINIPPVWGDIVLVRAGRDEIFARYYGDALVLPCGQELRTARWQLIGVVKPLDQFVRPVFPADIQLKPADNFYGFVIPDNCPN